ncbi:cyclin-domain-containing protein [Kalaharituber pfeilii]|nr:cyclin-domain-containing protein [Kalaharituber pfeilii]
MVGSPTTRGNPQSSSVSSSPHSPAIPNLSFAADASRLSGTVTASKGVTASPRQNHASPRAATALSRSSPLTSVTPRNTPSTAVSPPIAPRNGRRLSTPSTPLHRQSPPPRSNRPHASSTSSSPARRNSSRVTTPSIPPTLPQPHDMASPPRRPRIESTRKLLPPAYQYCDTADLVILISDMLGELVVLNDQIPLSTGGLTRFHSRAPPTISIPDYLSRLTLHSSLQPSILLAMVYYIDILSTLYPTFTISSLTVHRFLITAATVASKGLCDSFLTNGFYARVGGVSLMELNLLELEFLTRVGWRIVPRGEVLAEYYRSLVGRMSSRYAIDERATGLAGTQPIMAGEIAEVTTNRVADQATVPDPSVTDSASAPEQESAPGGG